MVRLFLLIKVLLISPVIFGQRNKEIILDTIYYNVLSNNTNFTYFGAGLNYDVTVNRAMVSVVSFGLNSKFINKRIEFNIDSRMHFSDGMSFIGEQTEIHSVKPYTKPRDASLQFIFYLINKNKVKENLVYLGKEGYTVYNIKIPMNVSYRIGVDASVDKGAHSFALNDFNDYRSMDGGIHEDEHRKSSTVHRFITFGYGLNFTKVDRISLSTKKYGETSFASIKRFTVKLNYLISSSLDDVEAVYNYSGTQPSYSYKKRLSVDHIDRSILGISLAYENYVFSEFPNGGYKFEIGIKPGVKYNFYDLLYFDFKFR